MWILLINLKQLNLTRKERVNNMNELTKEQNDLIPVYREKFRAIGLKCGPTDKKAAEAAIIKSYKYLKLAKPEIVWVTNPLKGAILAAQTAKGSKDVTPEEIEEQADFASYGHCEAYWVSTYAFIVEVLNKKVDGVLDIVMDIINNCGMYWSFDGLVILCEKPIAIHMVDEKLHNPNGYAIEFADGWNVCAINGVRQNSLMAAAISAKMG